MRSFFSLSVGIYCYSFALRTALAAFRKCWHVVFLFSFLSGYLLTPLWISSLTHLSFKSVLFDFHIVMDCLVFLLSLPSSFTLSWLEEIRAVVSVVSHVLGLALWPSTRSVLESVQGFARTRCIPAPSAGALGACLSGPFDLQCYSGLLFPDRLSVWMLHPVLQAGYRSPGYYCIAV